MAVSEFQLALIGTSAIAVVGVWGYNSWQEYRYRKAADKIFRGEQDDVLIDSPPVSEASEPMLAQSEAEQQDHIPEPRIEPVFSAPFSGQEAVQGNASEEAIFDIGPEIASDFSATAEEAIAIVETPDEAVLDAVIEVGMALPAAQNVVQLQATWQQINKIDFSKPVRWIARVDGGDEWIEVSSSAMTNATYVYVAIQLADRKGAIAADELRVFCDTAEAVALAHGGKTDALRLDEVVTHARAMDDLCASVDIQIAVHIVSRTGQNFAGSKLRGMLEAAGLKLAPDGFFYLSDGEGKRLLSVCNSGTAHFDIEQMRTGSVAGITFWLDVPRVSDGGRVFDTMVAMARQLATALDGVLVDDQRNPLADNVLAGIRSKVIELQTQMATHGMPAGGRRALRLFA